MILYELGAYATIFVPWCILKFCLKLPAHAEQALPHADLCFEKATSGLPGFFRFAAATSVQVQL